MFLVDSFSFFLLFFFRKLNEGIAGFTAAPAIFFCAGRTLDEEQMTGTVDAVGMGIAGVAALVTNRYHIITDAFAQAIVKYKVLAYENIIQLFFLYLMCIVDDTSFQVIHMLKAMVQHIGTGFFAPDPSCAVHDDIPVFVFLQHVNRHG